MRAYDVQCTRFFLTRRLHDRAPCSRVKKFFCVHSIRPGPTSVRAFARAATHLPACLRMHVRLRFFSRLLIYIKLLFILIFAAVTQGAQGTGTIPGVNRTRGGQPHARGPAGGPPRRARFIDRVLTSVCLFTSRWKRYNSIVSRSERIFDHRFVHTSASVR